QPTPPAPRRPAPGRDRPLPMHRSGALRDTAAAAPDSPGFRRRRAGNASSYAVLYPLAATFLDAPQRRPEILGGKRIEWKELRFLKLEMGLERLPQPLLHPIGEAGSPLHALCLTLS